MGSLMSGWNSPVSDPTSVIHERNRSLTKEEIEAYWRSKKQTEEEHLKAILLQSHLKTILLQAPLEEYGRKYMRSNSNTLSMDAETNPDNILNKTGWWRMSNWAFLNEPPVVDPPINSYKPQFHIAKLNKDSGITV